MGPGVATCVPGAHVAFTAFRVCSLEGHTHGLQRRAVVADDPPPRSPRRATRGHRAREARFVHRVATMIRDLVVGMAGSGGGGGGSAGEALIAGGPPAG